MDKELTFAENFKKYRKKKGISQKEFKEKLFDLTGKNLTLTSISNYETGLHMPPPQMLPAVAAILEVSIDTLFRAKEFTSALLHKDEVEENVAEEVVIQEVAEVDEAQRLNALESLKKELQNLEKEFYYLKITQAKALEKGALPVLECCENIIELAKKQQDELLVMQTELITVRELMSFFQSK